MSLRRFATQVDFSPSFNPCPRCRFIADMERLRKTQNESTPLDQTSYERLHELLAHYDMQPAITLDLVCEAREEVHRLNLKKVRYENLVEAHKSDETSLGKEELEELLKLLSVFDDTNVEMREGVVRMIEARGREEEKAKRKERREKRKGVIGISLSVKDTRDIKEQSGCHGSNEKLGSGRSSWI